MKLTASIAASLAATVLWTSTASARPMHTGPAYRAHMVQTTFRLRLSADADPGTTFWVSHGPLGGHFGMIQLLPAGEHLYSATVSLPANGKTTFAYLSGHGALKTRMGRVPGNPVTTIRVLDDATAYWAALRTVTWQPPAG